MIQEQVAFHIKIHLFMIIITIILMFHLLTRMIFDRLGIFGAEGMIQNIH